MQELQNKKHQQSLLVHPLAGNTDEAYDGTRTQNTDGT